MKDTVLLEAYVPIYFEMTSKNLYDNLLNMYKEEWPEKTNFDKVHFFNYIKDNKNHFIRRAFNLTSNIKIEKIEIDTIFCKFEEYFNGLFSKERQ